MMTLIIEIASVHHLDTLYEIEKECFQAEAFSRHQIASLLSDYNSIGLVAKENQQIAGFIIGTTYFERNTLTGHILTIDVKPAERQKGIGARLLKEIERIFKEKNVKTCRLEVREDNLPALNLYQKLGYKKIERLQHYYGDTNGLYLCKSF
jgi:ribosomal-protein-alanine acetyltransferase